MALQPEFNNCFNTIRSGEIGRTLLALDFRQISNTPTDRCTDRFRLRLVQVSMRLAAALQSVPPYPVGQHGIPVALSRHPSHPANAISVITALAGAASWSR